MSGNYKGRKDYNKEYYLRNKEKYRKETKQDKELGLKQYTFIRRPNTGLLNQKYANYTFEQILDAIGPRKNEISS